MPTVLLRFALLFFALTSLSTAASAQDSIHLKIQPVQCFGMRNGEIEIVTVYWGNAPYYFSLDGQSYSTRPLFDLLYAGEYVVHVRDSTGKEVNYPALVTEPEELRVQLSINDTTIVPGEWFQIKATVYPTNTVLSSVDWRPQDVFWLPKELNQTVRIADSTDFSIEIQDLNGCTAHDNLFVAVKRTNLYFPNAFSPNSYQDNYFTLFAGDGVERVISMQIFDRNGVMVFEKRNFSPSDPLSGWNGKSRGRMAPPGVYAWVAQVEFLDGTKEEYSGSVTLMN